MHVAPAAIERARDANRGVVVRTPLIRLDAPGTAEIYVKLENLQPTGSFKVRGAYSAMLQASRGELGSRVATISAGNMALGVARAARELGVEALIVVPDHAPEAKLAAIARLGGEVVKVSVDRWFDALVSGRVDGFDGFVVHPTQDEPVIAGNATIGLEIVEDLPDVDAVFVACGGGGLAVGVASGLRARGVDAPVYAVQPASAAALAASLDADVPVPVAYSASFVDGAGAKVVLPRMWPRLRSLVAGAPVVSLDATAAAVRLLAERHHVIAEGAGALSVAAALQHGAAHRKIVAVVSGGNIDAAVLCEILAGRVPGPPPVTP